MRSISLWASFRHAFAGLWHVLRTQRNARIHLAVAILVVIAGVLLRVRQMEWIALAFAIGLVFAAETFNTAIESVVDLLSPDRRESARIAKDTAAAMVLCTAVTAAIVGGLVFVPRLLELTAYG